MTPNPSSASAALRSANAPPSSVRPVPNVPGGPLDRVPPERIPDPSPQMRPRPPVHDHDIDPGAGVPQGERDYEAESPVPDARHDPTGQSPPPPPVVSGGI